MTESEFLRRMDLYVERSERHLARGNEITAANEIMTEANEVHRDHRACIREMTGRQERVTDQLVRGIETTTERLAGQMDAGRVVLEDVSLATRQHTQALARVLDRLD